MRFHSELVAAAGVAAGGGETPISGPLHDSAALAQAGIPTVMLFTSSVDGVSHASGGTPPSTIAAAVNGGDCHAP